MYFFRMLPSSSFTLAVYWVWQSSPEQQWGTGLDWEHSGVTGLIFIIRLHLIFCLGSGNFIWEVWAFVDKASLMPRIVWGFRWLLYRRSKCTADQAEWRGKGQTRWAARLKIQREFEGLHFSSQCFWTRAEDLLSLLWVVPVCLPEGNEEALLSCQLSICWLEKREIKQVIPKSTKGNTALSGSRWWLRNTAYFFYRTWCSLLA